MIKEDKVYLKHIMNEIIKIEKSAKNISQEDFKKDDNIQDATIRRIEIIGEATKNVSIKLKNAHPEIEWKKIAGTRDVLIHAYFSVDIELTWNIVKIQLPDLKEKIKKILEELI